MKKLLLSIIFASIAFASVNANEAPCKVERNWYVQATGSFDWINKTKGKTIHSRGKHNGIGGALAIGYILDCWRIELEGRAIKGNASLMANIFYDIPLTDIISLYLGAGAGISSVQANLKTHTQRKKGHQDTVGAGQLMAGIFFAVSNNIDLFTGYRLFATTKPTYKVGKHRFKINNTPLVQSAELGIRFKF